MEVIVYNTIINHLWISAAVVSRAYVHHHIISFSRFYAFNFIFQDQRNPNLECVDL